MEAMTEYLIVAAGCVSGIAGHILKKVIQQRETNSSFTLKDFLVLYPYKTVLTIFYAVGGTAGLYFSDAATFYTALTIGFAANSLSGASDK